eukprot:CAMPEP_0172450964 /NCGR_PEP_ID=MMETSP1065-20121228/9145_1 /TAXON_ID=265537 /ORGANISM="Amphiprora paludosa, Strain CCMP125" /LENGTH=112 /DNA_ID=CAMNT_0013202833 /DNA_START=209 /DNA_END=547 /DNA_ORIENTATION=-
MIPQAPNRPETNNDFLWRQLTLLQHLTLMRLRAIDSDQFEADAVAERRRYEEEIARYRRRREEERAQNQRRIEEDTARFQRHQAKEDLKRAMMEEERRILAAIDQSRNNPSA